MNDDGLLDWLDGFHSCALVAYVQIWRQTDTFPPDSEAVRQLAYQYYEEYLSKQDRNKRS
jgi:hypothetical protein